jgi:hypothetical protein
MPRGPGVVERPQERRVEVRLPAVGHPGLLAAGQPAVVPALGGGAHGGWVGAGVRLREAVRTEQPAADELREDVATLLGRAEPVDGEAGQRVDAQPQGHARPSGGQLLDDLEVDRVGLRATADVLGEGQPEQAGVAEQPEHLAGKALLALVLRGLRCQFGVGDLAGQRDEILGLAGGQFAIDGHSSPCDVAPTDGTRLGRRSAGTAEHGGAVVRGGCRAGRYGLEPRIRTSLPSGR